jgi:YgiT-type zinc finger domain-containing protein
LDPIEMTKKTEKKFCPECQGIIKPGRAKLVYRLTDIKISVNNMKANICSQCGQAFLSGRVAEELNRLVNRVSEDVTSFIKTQPEITQNHKEVVIAL